MNIVIDERFFRSIDEQFTELLARMPMHWFSEKGMKPITYAMYQAFCMCYGYEFGVFDVATDENRITRYIETVVKGIKIKEPVYSIWGQHPDDWKILMPIYQREKEKYLKSLEKENV